MTDRRSGATVKIRTGNNADGARVDSKIGVSRRVALKTGLALGVMRHLTFPCLSFTVVFGDRPTAWDCCFVGTGFALGASLFLLQRFPHPAFQPLRRTRSLPCAIRVPLLLPMARPSQVGCSSVANRRRAPRPAEPLQSS